MMMDNADFVDQDLVVQERNNLGSNRIRLKQLSFAGVTKAWNDYRRSKLTADLREMEDKLAASVAFTDSEGNMLESEKAKILEKTEAIARLEEQIRVIDREDVPQDFVKSRAIKLQNSWLENCRYNGTSAYSVGLANKDKLFGVEETPAEPELALDDTAEITSAEMETPEEVVDAVEASERTEESELEEQVLSDLTADLGDNTDDGPTLDEISAEINRALDSLSDTVDTPDISVSKNAGAAARIDKYEEQEKPIKLELPTISFDDIFSASSSSKDDMESGLDKPLITVAEDDRQAVVVPERQEESGLENEVDIAEQIVGDVFETEPISPEISLPTDVATDLAFDYTEATEGDVVKAASRNLSARNFAALKNRVLELEQQRQASRDKRKDAEKRAQEASDRAAEAKKVAKEKQAQYDRKVAEINRYIESLEELRDSDEKHAEIAANDERSSERFISQQYSIVDSIDEAMQEMDSLLSGTDLATDDFGPKSM